MPFAAGVRCGEVRVTSRERNAHRATRGVLEDGSAAIALEENHLVVGLVIGCVDSEDRSLDGGVDQSSRERGIWCEGNAHIIGGEGDGVDTACR